MSAERKSLLSFPHITEQLDFTAGVYVNSWREQGSNHSQWKVDVLHLWTAVSGFNFINTDADFGFIVLVSPCLHVIMGYVGIYTKVIYKVCVILI